jgi:hypothetical protein
LTEYSDSGVLDKTVSLDDLSEVPGAILRNSFALFDGYQVTITGTTGEQGASWTAVSLVVELVDGFRQAGWELLAELIVAEIVRQFTPPKDDGSDD